MVARILVAEEHAPSLVLMLHLLKGRRYSTVFAMDGDTAVSLARDVRPDLIICDSRLASSDGKLVALQISRDRRLKRTPLLAVLDASRFEVVGGRKTPLGFAGHVSKPIDRNSFIQTVERCLPGPLRAVRQPLRLRSQRRRTDLSVWRTEPQ